MANIDSDMSYIDIYYPRPQVKIRMADRAICPSDFHWDNRSQMHWKGFNIWYIARGTGRLKVEGTEYVLSPGDCFLLRLWEHHIGINGNPGALIIPWVVFNYFDRRGKGLTPEYLRTLPPRYRRMSNIAFFNDLMQHIIDRSKAGDDAAALFWLDAALKEMAVEDERQKQEKQGRRRENTVNLFDLLCTEIQENPGKRYRIEELAQKQGCSRDHFIRLFREAKGTTPMDFIIQARMDAASNLLLFSEHTLAAIAERLGYADPFIFSRQFKRKTGLSPSQYREKHLDPSPLS
jgi:AraC family transcriptional regulator, arabinose operon regulatory protein